MTQWQKINPFGEEGSSYWVRGIYKIVSYNKGEYHAFFIRNNAKNWGDHVSPPPANGKYGKIWASLRCAQKACDAHQKTGWLASEATKKRAAELLLYFKQQEKDYLKKILNNLTQNQQIELSQIVGESQDVKLWTKHALKLQKRLK